MNMWISGTATLCSSKNFRNSWDYYAITSSSDASFVKRLLSSWCVATLSQSILGGGCIYVWPASIMLNAEKAFGETFANSKAESVEVRASRKIDIWLFEIWKQGLC